MALNGYNFLNIKKNLFMDALGPCCCTGLSLVVVSGGLLFTVVLRFFTVVASLVELRL